METKNPVPEVRVHKQFNPFMGKAFKVNTYNDQDEVIDTEDVKIESQEELKTVIDEVKQYNIAFAYLTGSERKYKKLITE
nr:MAG TPA: hypothetical protein [Herelleviridae sp.]